MEIKLFSFEALNLEGFADIVVVALRIFICNFIYATLLIKLEMLSNHFVWETTGKSLSNYHALSTSSRIFCEEH